MADGVSSAQFGPRGERGSRGTARALLLVRALWHGLTRNLAGGYRPERHYMRGPGPKSHEHNSRGSD
jgi:hypothetical protein